MTQKPTPEAEALKPLTYTRLLCMATVLLAGGFVAGLVARSLGAGGVKNYYAADGLVGIYYYATCTLMLIITGTLGKSIGTSITLLTLLAVVSERVAKRMTSRRAASIFIVVAIGTALFFGLSAIVMSLAGAGNHCMSD